MYKQSSALGSLLMRNLRQKRILLGTDVFLSVQQKSLKRLGSSEELRGPESDATFRGHHPLYPVIS